MFGGKIVARICWFCIKDIHECNAEPCKKRIETFPDFYEEHTSDSKLHPAKLEYAVCGQDIGVCPQSLGEYEIARFKNLLDARKTRDAKKREAKQCRISDSIFILPVRGGTVDWQAKAIQ